MTITKGSRAAHERSLKAAEETSAKTSKRQGGLNIDQLTDWLNIKGKRSAHRYNSKQKKRNFFVDWAYGHGGRRGR